ncbi:MAG: hypothetical protein DWQ37_06700 [Planctomycetota bacterium]|nr:MAG: hypothetical protein DWQ37_06700 [Planctomycetota bacterium]
MRYPLLATALVAGMLSVSTARGAEDLPFHRHPGYHTERSVYGYRPYKSFVGPIRARYALDPYVYSPRKAGVDYSWGLGYFFGRGPGDRAYQSAPQR